LPKTKVLDLFAVTLTWYAETGRCSNLQCLCELHKKKGYQDYGVSEKKSPYLEGEQKAL